MTDGDDVEVGVYRSVFADILSDESLADILVHQMRAQGVTSAANSVTFVLLDDD
jgi:hypothetical protein